MHTSQDMTLSFYYSFNLRFTEKIADNRMGRKAKCKPFIEFFVLGNVLYAGNPVINKTLCPN